MSRPPITLDEIFDFAGWLASQPFVTHRCPECGVWSGAPFTCQSCGEVAVTQGEYLTRRACGAQPARLPGSAT